MELAVCVTSEHIEAGIRKSGNHRPLRFAVDEALSKLFPDWVFSVVSRRAIRIFGKYWYQWEYILPDEIRQWIMKWESGAEVEPFVFTFSIPSEVVAVLQAGPEGPTS